jgi:hypothetical protein
MSISRDLVRAGLISGLVREVTIRIRYNDHDLVTTHIEAVGPCTVDPTGIIEALRRGLELPPLKRCANPCCIGHAELPASQGLEPKS